MIDNDFMKIKDLNSNKMLDVPFSGVKDMYNRTLLLIKNTHKDYITGKGLFSLFVKESDKEKKLLYVINKEYCKWKTEINTITYNTDNPYTDYDSDSNSDSGSDGEDVINNNKNNLGNQKITTKGGVSFYDATKGGKMSLFT
jgi:hypothetical protein